MDDVQRRNYYRIDDNIQFSWRVVTEEEKQQALSTMVSNSNQSDENRFLQLENQIQESLANLRTYNPELSKIIDLINSKVNQLSVEMPGSLPEHSLMKSNPQVVNIGIKGMAFDTPHTCHQGQSVFVEMILSTSHAYLALWAKVVACEPIANKNGMHRVSLEFDVITSKEMECLSQHIMRLDAEQTQQRKSKPADLH